MCGRTACTLAPSDVQKACRFKDKKGKRRDPDWRDAPDGKSYFPSYNIAPGAYTPVLLSAKHVPRDETCSSPRVIQPMQWGLIPSWHKGSAKEKAYETNNCRSESMMEKSTYKVPLQKGRRCVVLAEGFFEWKRDKYSKQPYYIYFPKSKEGNDNMTSGEVKVKVEVKDEEENGQVKVKVETEDVKQENQDDVDDIDGDDSVPRLLTMAGVFDVWKPPDGGEAVYSYSVITVESSSAMSWLHHRMPAILSSDDEIDQWLDFGEVPLNKAVQLIRPVTCISSHPVSSVVNNSRNNTPECIKKVDPSKPKQSASSNMMMAWLSKGQTGKVKAEPSAGQPPLKKVKSE